MVKTLQDSTKLHAKVTHKLAQYAQDSKGGVGAIKSQLYTIVCINVGDTVSSSTSLIHQRQLELQHTQTAAPSCANTHVSVLGLCALVLLHQRLDAHAHL